MHALVFLLTYLIGASQALAPTNHTWYVRADGAPHYSSAIASLSWRGLDVKHTCDGMHDAPWPAVGTLNVLGAVSTGDNQPCAIDDFRWLYDDQGSYGQLKWIISGGDTIIIDNTKQWRVGWDGDGRNASSEPWCWGWSGGPYGCFNPTIPAGSSGAPTRILGRNFADCNTPDGSPSHAKMSQIFAGHASGAALNLSDAAFVEVQCIELTQHATDCVRHGDPPLPRQCNSDFTGGLPVDDYGGSGAYTSTGTHDLLLKDLWVHGFTDRGLIGAIGGLVTVEGVDISTNAMSGWDFDDGRATASVNASLHATHMLIEYSGCSEGPGGTVETCYSQSTGGYGDGIGTPAGSGMDVYIDHSIFRYNTQDGPDFVHVDEGDHVLQFTNNQSYGNSGASLKFGGAFKTATISNNVLIANCSRLSAPLTGNAQAFNAHLSDYCRAFNGFGFGVYNGNHVTFSNNTLIGYAPTLIDPACGDTTCADSVFTFTNNIVRGYDNPATYILGGKSGGPGLFCGYQCDNTTQPIGTIVRDHNIYFGTHGDGLVNQPTGYALHETATNEISVDPLFINEPTGTGSTFVEGELDNFNTALAPGSPAAGLKAGAAFNGEPPTATPPTATPLPIEPVVPVSPVTPVPLPLGYLDTAVDSLSKADFLYQSGTLMVTGWAGEYTDGKGARSVNVLVDGAVVGSTAPTLSRPDAAAYMSQPGWGNCGWSLVLSASTLAPGVHTVSAVAVDSLGRSAVLSTAKTIFIISEPTASGTATNLPIITITMPDGARYTGIVEKVQ